jgi:hypothetical protein
MMETETYIVRIYRRNNEQVTGLLEIVGTDCRIRFQGLDELQRIIAQASGPGQAAIPRMYA